jgi:VWFA-related protein
LALAGWAAGARGQEPKPGESPTFSMDVQLVNVAFTVRDGSGTLITGLERKDVEVYENGEKQEIRAFAREEQTPLTLGLVLDRSPSQDEFEEDNIFAAVTFFRRVLRPQDKAFVTAFGNRIKLISPMTASLDGLERSLKSMQENYDSSPRVGPSVSREGGSAVIDAIYWPVIEHMKNVDGRKALIMIGDGKENASKRRMIDAIDALQAEDVIFYGLDNGGSEPNKKLRNRMPTIAEESGGRVFALEGISPKRAFEEIEMELRTMYSLAYSSSKPARDGSYRKVEVRVLREGAVVRAKPGYYAK